MSTSCATQEAGMVDGDATAGAMSTSLVPSYACLSCSSSASSNLPALVLLLDPSLLVVGVSVPVQGAGPLAVRVPSTHPVLALLLVILLLVL